MAARRFTDEQEHEIASEYQAGTNAPQLAVTYSTSRNTIYDVLRRQRVERRTVAKSNSLPADHTVFDELTEESEYWAGFITADGCLHHPKNQSPILSVGLSEKDVEHLEKLKRYFKSEHKIRCFDTSTKYPDGTNHRAASYELRSKYVVGRLESLGVKSTNISRELIKSRHYWRGVIDGDGSVGITRHGGRVVTLSGQMHVLEPFQKHIQEVLGIHGKIVPGHGRDCFSIRVFGNSAYTVVDYLYQESSISLDRKKITADKIISMGIKRR